MCSFRISLGLLVIKTWWFPWFFYSFEKHVEQYLQNARTVSLQVLIHSLFISYFITYSICSSNNVVIEHKIDTENGSSTFRWNIVTHLQVSTVSQPRIPTCTHKWLVSKTYYLGLSQFCVFFVTTITMSFCLHEKITYILINIILLL
jgi:hypothetical protein